MKLDYGVLGLVGDLTITGCEVGAVIDNFAVDPNVYFVAESLDPHRVPTADRVPEPSVRLKMQRRRDSTESSSL